MQELICLRAIRDVNVPKFLLEDLKLFSGIVSDLFPTIKEEETNYGILDKAIRKACEKSNLRDVDGEPLAPAGSSHLGILVRGTETGRPASEALRPGQVCRGLGISVKQLMGQGRCLKPCLQAIR